MSDIQRRIDEVLESVNNIERAKPNPFFFTRLEARLKREQKSAWEHISRLVTRPAIALASVSLVLIINALVVFQEINTIHTSPELTDMASAEELRTTSFYDFENSQP